MWQWVGQLPLQTTYCETWRFIRFVISYYLVGGWLLDYMEFGVLMPVVSLLLAINLASIYFIAIGLILSVWFIYILGFAHFTTIPAQVFCSGPDFF